LFNILKLISPILPHISEEIYQNYYKKFEKEISIHNFSYPFLQESDISMKDLNLEVEKLFEVFD
jgi:valyl-tRNA synthetase